ncbi:MAG: DUF4411 family protein [Deltaproteobacteria bacterium]|nr:DUF4411 family protein [Deltaproteobacteria bacterium]
MSEIQYLFDADTLIISKNIHYSPEFCPGFWEWIVTGNQSGVFFTIDRVAKELKTGKEEDFLYQFIETHHHTFVKETKTDIE